MRKIMNILFAAVVASVSTATVVHAAEDAPSGSVVIKQKEDESVFKGFMYKIWGKLRAISPRSAAVKPNRSVATAGVRGAETTTSIISPYWKDDDSEDSEYIAELAEFTKAQQLAEEGKLDQAVNALNGFIDKYNDSDFRANAQFALGMSYGGLGRNAESVKAMQDFIDDNPKHPMVSDAKEVISQLR